MTNEEALQLQFANQLSNPPKKVDPLGLQSMLTAIDRYNQNNYMTKVGPAWSANNAEFEATNPSLLNRMGRAINPMTGFGSAAGAMHDGASQGSIRDMGLAALQSLPQLGMTSPSLRGIALGNDVGATFAKGLFGLTVSGLVDEVQSATTKVGQK